MSPAALRAREMTDRRRSRYVIVVLVTCPNQALGEKIGLALVEEGPAACVNVVS